MRKPPGLFGELAFYGAWMVFSLALLVWGFVKDDWWMIGLGLFFLALWIWPSKQLRQAWRDRKERRDLLDL